MKLAGVGGVGENTIQSIVDYEKTLKLISEMSVLRFYLIQIKLFYFLFFLPSVGSFSLNWDEGMQYSLKKQ